MHENEIGVVSPVGLPGHQQTAIAPRLETLQGKTIGEVYNHHFKGDQMFGMYRQLLQQRYPGVRVIPYTELPASFVGGDTVYHRRIAKEIAAQAKAKGCDALIVGNGGWGTCTPAAVRPAVEAEKAGIPSVVVTLTGFTEVAHQAAKAMGVGGLRIAEYPGAVGVHHEDEVRKNVEQVLFDRIIEGLTKHHVIRDTSTSVPVQNPDEIVFRGTSDQVQEFFRSQQWTDGLPIIPPTPERVEAFLRYTDRAPDESIAVLPQANLEAVPWNIAANGVMAGCRPEHMPILIAVVEAIADEHYNLNNIGTTWGVVPYLMINGPIVQQLGIANAGQLVSKGPNPALGRALGLIIKNIAGYQPGDNYMGTFGYPLCFALAENEAASPWEPFHVEHGFDRNTSTVTAGATVTWGWPPSPYDTSDKTAAQSALEFLCVDITKKPCLPRLAERGPHGFRNMITLLLAPPVAKALAAAGYTKQTLRQYLYEHAKVPVREIGWGLTYGHPEAFTVQNYVELGIYPPEYLVEPETLARVLPTPDIVHIVVCGDPDRNRIMTLWSGYVQPVTKPIELPAQWDDLVWGGKWWWRLTKTMGKRLGPSSCPWSLMHQKTCNLSRLNLR